MFLELFNLMGFKSRAFFVVKKLLCCGESDLKPSFPSPSNNPPIPAS